MLAELPGVWRVRIHKDPVKARWWLGKGGDKEEFLECCGLHVTCLGQCQTFYFQYLFVLEKIVNNGENNFQNGGAAKGILHQIYLKYDVFSRDP